MLKYSVMHMYIYLRRPVIPCDFGLRQYTEDFYGTQRAQTDTFQA